MNSNVVRDQYGIGTQVLRSRVTQALVIGYIGLGIWYLWWRTFHTVNVDALYLSIPLLFAEYLGFAFFLLFAFSLWSRVRRFAPPPPVGLSVDVFIPSYNEPHSVLKPTILSALAMDYPHRTYVLDDGKREDVRLLCQQLGAEYLTRGDNKGAKAGNINAALRVTNGDVIAIFDADHAPFKEFLTELLGYFRDPQVGLAQAPQAYFNLDSFQHSAAKEGDHKPWHEQSVFYDMIMPGKDRMDAAFWCGSSAIVRRTALESVGGVDTRTITEDMHTAMGMHANGWKSVYHDRDLAVGIAPDDLEPFLVQRLRWAQGAMDILRKDNPLKRRGLSIRQRLSYFTSCVYVFEYLPKVIFLTMPPIALISGVLPMTNMGWNLLFRFAPFYLFGMLVTQRLTQGTNPIFRAERFHILKLEIMLRAMSFLFWPRKLKFKVTSKSTTGAQSRWGIVRHIRFQVIAGVTSALAAVWGTLAWLFEAPWALTGISLAVTVAWAAINAGLVADLVRSVLVRRHRREVYRFEVAIPMSVSTGARTTLVETVDLSTTGVAWASARWVPVGKQLRVDIGEGPMAVETLVKVVACRAAGVDYRVGAEFVDLSAENERRLVLMLFKSREPRMVAAPDAPRKLEPLAA